MRYWRHKFYHLISILAGAAMRILYHRVHVQYLHTLRSRTRNRSPFSNVYHLQYKSNGNFGQLYSHPRVSSDYISMSILFWTTFLRVEQSGEKILMNKLHPNWMINYDVTQSASNIYHMTNLKLMHWNRRNCCCCHFINDFPAPKNTHTLCIWQICCTC